MFISEIQRQVAARHIACLVHFTSTTSLEGIVRDGKILSTQRLLDRSPMIGRNDRKRLDDHLDYVCCSLQIPNVDLLDNYRKKRPDQEWVHLCLIPDLLGLTSTRFSPVNAAAQRGSRVCGGIDGFQAMFADCVRRPLYGGGWRTSRRKGRFNHLPDYLPTDSHAEVLVCGLIPIAAVIDVVFESEQLAYGMRHVTDKLPVSRPTVQARLFDKEYVNDLWNI